MKAAVAAHKRTNKALLARLIAAERKAEELEEQLQFEVSSSKEVAAKRISLEKKISSIAKIPMDDGVKLTPTQLKDRLKKATKQVELWEAENAKLSATNLKLERQVESLQSRNEVLRAKSASKKVAAEVRKLELKHQIEELAMKREIRRAEDRIRLEREKADMNLKQMEAKFSASQASNEAKSSRRVQEAQEKAEAAAKRRKASYFGSNLVSCRVNIIY